MCTVFLKKGLQQITRLSSIFQSIFDVFILFIVYENSEKMRRLFIHTYIAEKKIIINEWKRMFSQATANAGECGSNPRDVNNNGKG